MQNKTPKYTTIIHKIRIELKLSCNEYCIADIIYSLSNNPDSKVKNWCYASKDTIGKFLGITERAVHEIIKRLIEKGIIEKDEETKYLKTTSLWYQSIILERIKMRNVHYEKSSATMKKVQPQGEESSAQEGEVSSYYNNNKDINNNNIVSKDTTASRGNEDINFLISFLKEKMNLNMLDGTIAENRRYCWLALQKFKKEGVELIIGVASQDKFWSNKITSFKSLYYKGIQIASSIKDINNPKLIKI